MTPGAHLGVGEYPENVAPADSVAADPRAFGDDQSGRSALGVVLRVQVSR